MRKRKIVNHVRKGPLSNEDKSNIEDWADKKSPEDMARDLNRSVVQVKRYFQEYMARAPRVTVRRSEAEEFRRELHAQPNWHQTRQEFTEDELTFYENIYVEYRHQFRDMTASELSQLHKLITLDVFMHRLNMDRMKIQNEITQLERNLKKARDSLIDGDTNEYAKIARLEEQYYACKGVTSSKTKEYNELLSKHGDIMKTMKGTCDQRIKSIDDRGKFISILKELEIESRRKLITEMTGLVDLAVAKERERLSAPHQYVDKMIDQPLLNAENVIDE